MNTLSGYPYCEIQFTKDATVFDKNAVDQLEAMLKDENITDLFVISHGWNNDMDDARNLYQNLVAKMASQAKAVGTDNRKFGVLGVLWPSKKFAEKDLIAGGAASLSAPQNTDEASEIMTQLNNLHDFFDVDTANEILMQIKNTVPQLETDKDAQAKFVSQLSELVSSAIKKESDHVDEERLVNFDDTKPDDLLVGLSDDWNDNATNAGGAAGGVTLDNSGGAAGLGDFFSGVFSGARNLLNFVTFFQMKERAGKVGSLGLNPVLKEIRLKMPAVKLHLMGHSFGARVVTAATAGINESDTLKVNTLTLLQGAFSHYGFSEKYDNTNNGFFRRVISQHKVMGPVLITHTHNDAAVGLAYAIAERIGREEDASIGDANDVFGGMGGNGAQKTPEASDEFNLKTNTYDFKSGVIYNLNADTCIFGHSDICKDEVGKAVMAAVSVA